MPRSRINLPPFHFPHPLFKGREGAGEQIYCHAPFPLPFFFFLMPKLPNAQVLFRCALQRSIVARFTTAFPHRPSIMAENHRLKKDGQVVNTGKGPSPESTKPKVTS